MITLVSDGKALDVLPADPFCARITALFDTYGANYDFALFWIQDEGSAAISRIDGAATVYADENADYEELSEFLKAIGYSDMICNKTAAENLKLEIDDSSFIVKYNDSRSVDESGILKDYDKKEIYALLCSCGFSMGSYGAFLADFCSRLNKKTAFLSAIADDDGLCACASALFSGRKSTLLGAVATKKEKRGRGYAEKLVRCLAKNGRGEIYLFCRNDSLAGFYEKCGFEICGCWAAVKK